MKNVILSVLPLFIAALKNWLALGIAWLAKCNQEGHTKHKQIADIINFFHMDLEEVN